MHPTRMYSSGSHNTARPRGERDPRNRRRAPEHRRTSIVTREAALTLLLSVGAALGTAWGVAKLLGFLETGGLP